MCILLVSSFSSGPKEKTQEISTLREIATTTNVGTKPIITDTIVRSTTTVVAVKPVHVDTKTETSKTEEKKQQLYIVSSVVDGDTIKINNNGTIETLRLIGMDTPETVDPRKTVQCFGLEASNKAKELLSGKKVYLEKDPTQGELDKYGRILVYVYREDGLFYNEYMIKQGYAHEYTYNIPYKYQTGFKTAQSYAQTNHLGLWSPNTCNGNTTSSAIISQTAAETSTGIKYYTSSASNATKYYPETCYAWERLSKTNLKVFRSLEELLVVYPSRTIATICK